MASIHPIFKAPMNPQMTLWRYMDRVKYERMLQSKALYFSRADKLGDTFEGSDSRATIQARIDAFRKAAPAHRGDHTTLEHLLIAESYFGRMPKLTFINCWHKNDVESAAMWRLYAEQGIAIRTTCAKIMLLAPANVFLIEVQYANYGETYIPDHEPIAPFVFKRKSFAHENEVRAIIQEDPATQGDLDSRPAGKLTAVSLTDLIDSVFIFPSATDAFKNEIEHVTSRHGLRVKIQRSEIDSPALF